MGILDDLFGGSSLPGDVPQYMKDKFGTTDDYHTYDDSDLKEYRWRCSACGRNNRKVARDSSNLQCMCGSYYED